MSDPHRAFRLAQQRFLEHHGVDARSSFVPVPSIQGHAHVLTTGHGRAVVMLNGIGTPGAMWAPLVAQLHDVSIHVVDLPGYGLTDTTPTLASDLRSSAVRFLQEVLAALGLQSPAFVANSLGSLWTTWFVLERPEQVSRIVHIGCPAIVLGTSAPLPMRLLATPGLGRLMTSIQPPSRSQVEQLGRMVRQHPLGDDLIELLVETERLPGFRETLLSTLHALLTLRGARPAMSPTRDDLARIEAPTLIFWGDKEPFGSVDVGRQMVAAMPNAQLHVVRGGHGPWLTDAERIGRLAQTFLVA